MKKYLEPEMELVVFECEDIVTASVTSDDVYVDSDGNVVTPWG